MASADRVRGFLSQGMNGKRAQAAPSIIGFADTASNGSIFVPKGCIAFIGLWGGGKAGAAGNLGGDGGDAVFAAVRVSAGWTISWTIGAAGAQPSGAGGDTVVTLPGKVLRARGGGSASSNIGPYAVPGGVGGNNVDGSPGADGGGAGGAAANGGGGGGAAGLASKLPGFPTGGAGGPGGGASPGGAIGGGGGANNLGGTPGNGGLGRVLVLLIRAVTP